MSAFRNEILHGLGLSVLSFFIIYYLMKKLDPNNKSRALAREQTKQIIQKFKKTRKIKLDEFNDHEVVVTSHLIHQDDINVTWEDIAGLDTIVESIKKTVLVPIMRTDLISKSNLSQPPKGVLLYGPPGCGKTMIAKAIAKECSLPFINLDVSTLTDKWYGESQKLATAVFSAAKKLSPCIVFIDEIESFLRSRNSSDHEATAMIKTQFMIHWDGLISDSDCHVVIMGATNRPEDIDKAFLRRMPATFHIPLPNLMQRTRILSKILEKEQVDKNVDIDQISQLTERFSGADLKEICRTASVYRLSEIDSTTTELRSITMDDLMNACNKIKTEMTSS